jgi:hypothetical protein
MAMRLPEKLCCLAAGVGCEAHVDWAVHGGASSPTWPDFVAAGLARADGFRGALRKENAPVSPPRLREAIGARAERRFPEWPQRVNSIAVISVAPDAISAYRDHA